MNKKIIISLIILILISGLVFLGYFRNKGKGKKSIFVETPEETKPVPVSIPSFSLTPPSQPSQPTLFQVATPTKSYQPLFNQKFFYLDLAPPLLYVYDPEEGIIKYFDLENEAYKEIYKVFNLKNATLSQDKEKIILETENGFQLLDLKKDSLENLPPLVKNFVFSPKGLILYITTDKTVSYLAYFHNGKIIKIRDLGILNPEIVALKNSLLIYEKNSPVFILDLNNPKNLKVFLEEKEDYSLLVNKNHDLIFVSFRENGWQSKIIDGNKKLKISFSWGTIKEKCSFDDVLVCALPMSLENFDPQAWRLLEPSYDEKLIIYNPANNKIKEIKLESKFDIVKPKLTPLGIIFWNRLDAKFYLVKLEETSL